MVHNLLESCNFEGFAMYCTTHFSYLEEMFGSLQWQHEKIKIQRETSLMQNFVSLGSIKTSFFHTYPGNVVRIY